MRHVRYFGDLVDPTKYRTGYGFRGWCIGVINRVRVYLERWIVLQILGLEAVEHGWDVKDTLRAARANPDVAPWLALEGELHAPKLYHHTPSKSYASHEEKVRSRYGTPREERAPFAATFSRTSQRTDRSTRYVLGKGVHVYDDGYFEEVKVGE